MDAASKYLRVRLMVRNWQIARRFLLEDAAIENWKSGIVKCVQQYQGTNLLMSCLCCNGFTQSEKGKNIYC